MAEAAGTPEPFDRMRVYQRNNIVRIERQRARAVAGLTPRDAVLDRAIRRWQHALLLLGCSIGDDTVWTQLTEDWGEAFVDALRAGPPKGEAAG